MASPSVGYIQEENIKGLQSMAAASGDVRSLCVCVFIEDEDVLMAEAQAHLTGLAQ